MENKTLTRQYMRRFNGHPMPRTNSQPREIIHRPAKLIGRLLALQQVDGVDGSTSSLLSQQFDEAFGEVDPASDIHTERNLFRDQLMRAGYKKVFPTD